ncbi:MAG: ThuA domain-containing protein [Spirochaetales bacterium]|nr:ThuA domain-containing protein [Spirochaetales bacterium]
MVAPVRVLFLCFGDDTYHDHGAAGDYLRRFLGGRGFDVSVSNDPASSLVPAALAACDAVVLYAVSASAPAENVDHLLKAVSGARLNDRKRPVGFCGVHGATTSFQDNAGFRNMLGASFVSHPDMGPLYEFTVKDRSHPVTAGLADFRLKDELYCFDTHAPFTTLVSCRHETVERPVVWTKGYGSGNVFYIALGHGLEQMSDPNFQALLANGVHWAATNN